MVLSFNPQFILPILQKSKIHSIREDRCNRWKPGIKIQIATGQRTKEYKQHDEQVCVSTQKIDIRHLDHPIRCATVTIDGRSLNNVEIKQLAINDGFESIAAFYYWFKNDYTGKIIHWTDFKY